MKEAETLQIIFILLAGFLLFLTAERLQQRQNRKRLKHVIYVNGTRGKSTVTRMIDAGLRQLGFRVVSKTTGTLPMLLHADGRVEQLQRRGPANIREQLRMLHLAVKEQADILVVECMALSPENQFVSQHRMLQADIGVLTNARLDHTDVMGETREEILDTLLNTMPHHGTFVTAEASLFAQIEQKGRQLHTKTVLAVPDSGDEGIDFPDNVALARAVCEELGSDRQTALEGIRRYIRDPFAREVLCFGKAVFVNALSANDTESTLKVCTEALPLLPEEYRKILLINNREDRPARALAMSELALQWQPQEIWLIGEALSALKRHLRRCLPQVPVHCFSDVKDIPLVQEIPTLLLASGNIRGAGIKLTERTRQLAEKEN